MHVNAIPSSYSHYTVLGHSIPLALHSVWRQRLLADTIQCARCAVLSPQGRELMQDVISSRPLIDPLVILRYQDASHLMPRVDVISEAGGARG